MQTVKDLIGKDISIKLGAKDGSAFVYCGNMKDVDIQQVDNDIRRGYEITIKNAIDIISNLSKKDLSYEAYEQELERRKFKMISQWKNNPVKLAEIEEQYTPSKFGHHQWVSDITRRLERSKTTRKKVKRLLRDYTTVADRKIIEVYNSLLEPNTMIVLYDGKENGNAWTTDEFENIKKGDNTWSM